MSCKRSHRPEDAIQRAIVAHLTARAAPELWWRHAPNGGLGARGSGCARAPPKQPDRSTNHLAPVV